MRTMNDLMLHFLQDMYDAEKRGVRGMQKMARAASGEAVKDALMQHRDQSQQHISRLERVFELVTGKRPRGKPCAAMEGLTDEIDEAIEEGEKGPVLDAALIASAQAIEHYEIARYGAMAAWARQVGKTEVADLFRQTLEEEKRNDERLSALALRDVNLEAGETEGPDDEPDVKQPSPPQRGRTARKTGAKPEPMAEPAPKPAKRTPAKKPGPAPRRAARK